MEYHEAADIYPQLEGKEFDALVEDIRKNGLRVPILTCKGKILDGRNRDRACDAAGVKKRYEEWDGVGSPVDAVVSYNDARRHMESGQRAVSALMAEKLLAKEAKEKEAKRKSKKEGVTFPNLEKSPPLHSAKQAAKKFKVSHQYVSDAKKIDRQAPALIKDVHEGRLPIQDAKKVATLPEGVRDQAVQGIVRAKTPEQKRFIAREAVRAANQKPERPLYEQLYTGAIKADKLIHDLNQIGGVCVIAEMEDWEPGQRQVVIDAVRRTAEAFNGLYNELTELNQEINYDGEDTTQGVQYSN
jgi:hypothetical protein